MIYSKKGRNRGWANNVPPEEKIRIKTIYVLSICLYIIQNISKNNWETTLKRRLMVLRCSTGTIFPPLATEKWSPISLKPTGRQISEQFSDTRSSLSEKTREHLAIRRYHSKSSILPSVILKPWVFAAVVSYDLIQSENMKPVEFERSTN